MEASEEGCSFQSGGKEKLHISGRNRAILSAKELFQWRKKENLPVPQRGGAKEYEPDGSWLQDKRIEAFYEENLNVLREPRVEKSGNLVKGTWNSELKLVNIEKTAKFWMKMGFTDQHCNWLHPEEALFLMEVNSLEVMHHGVSLSLQEAYGILLHPTCGIREEEYQVYAHLRRLGFIVIRHVGKLNLTPYERRIGLDKHTRKKNKKRSKTADTSDNSVISKRPKVDTVSCADVVPQKDTFNNKPVVEEAVSSVCEEQNQMHDEGRTSKYYNMTSEEKKSSSVSTSTVCRNGSASDTGSEQWQDQKLTRNEVVPGEELGETKQAHAVNSDTEEPPAKRSRTDNTEGDYASPPAQTDLHTSDPWSHATRQSLQRQSNAPLSTWDFSVLDFPDIAGRDTVPLTIPRSDLLPGNVCVDEDYDDVCMFDVEEYRHQQHQQFTRDQMQEEYGHLKQLEFSYAAWSKAHCRPVTAKNWREWKTEMQHREHIAVMESPVAYLWKGDVTPLVQPQDAVSTASLLDKLSVIHTLKGPWPVQQSAPVKISFDVYLPNTTFRKSSPGLPNHRVCVTRDEHPPELFEMLTSTAHLGDGVPLHWAVVNCGDISFFVFEDQDIPVHPSSLG